MNEWAGGNFNPHNQKACLHKGQARSMPQGHMHKNILGNGPLDRGTGRGAVGCIAPNIFLAEIQTLPTSLNAQDSSEYLCTRFMSRRLRQVMLVITRSAGAIEECLIN